MTNEEASFYLSNMDRKYMEEGMSKALDMAIQALEQTRWIPVSERLPKEDGDYLLWGKIDKDEDEYTFIGSHDSGCEEFGIWQEQFDRTTLGCLGSDFFEYASVIAWMPLPEPYKADNRTEQGLAYADQDTMMPAT